MSPQATTIYGTMLVQKTKVPMTLYVQCSDWGDTHIIKWEVDVPLNAKGVLLVDVGTPAAKKAIELRVAIADHLDVPVSDILYVITGDL